MNAAALHPNPTDRDANAAVEGSEPARVAGESCAHDIVAGDIISGKFRVCRVLGVGGMGTVVEATHLGLDESVAVKILNREVGDDENAHERLFREAKATAKIRSEHAVKVTDVGKLDDGRPYLVMEYLEGRDLGDRLDRDGPLTISEACDVMIQVCDALSDAHELGIIHRDLKPSNLFQTLDRDGQVCIKVLDFGISKATKKRSDKRLTEDNTILGTPEYMSPEQLRGVPEIDSRSDIWALGVILFELLTNQVPFTGESTAALFAAILTTDPTPITKVRGDLPPAIPSAIVRCLAKNPDDRFVDVGELAWALAPFASDARQRLAERTARRSSSKIIAFEAQNTLIRRPKTQLPLIAFVAAVSAIAMTIGLWFIVAKATTTPNHPASARVTRMISPVIFESTTHVVAPMGTASSAPVAAPSESASSTPTDRAMPKTFAPAAPTSKPATLANVAKVLKKPADDPFGRQR